MDITSTPSRRRFLKTTAAVAGASALPFGSALAQGSTRYSRRNVSDPKLPARVLESYKKAIRVMLALPAGDPRNWYRNAIIHTLDCPHGNWWFLVWHRAYLGWFEQICRELSGDPEFALPYWDWTEHLDSSKPFQPRIPTVMFDDVLSPTNAAYVGKYTDFKAHFKDVVAKANYWERVYESNGVFKEKSPYGQLLARGIRFPEDLWFDIVDDPRGKMFFDLAHGRGLTKQKPEFDARTTKAVSLSYLLDALSARDFTTFGSPKTISHGVLTGFGVLEGLPHNRVHNNVGGISTVADMHGDPVRTDVGGFMQNNLSPVDPLFFLHHANIDRLWDVWTRKQQAFGYPILPTGYPVQPGTPVPEGSDYELWSTEQFFFFVDAKARPVSKTNAGDYAAIGDFSYSYQLGSGEEIVPTAAVAAVAGTAQIQRFSAQIVNPSLSTAVTTSGGVVKVPSALLAATGRTGAPKLFARVTIALPPLAHFGDFAVLANAPGDAVRIDPASPHYVATLSMFGHHNLCAPVTFTVPLSGTLGALRSAERLNPEAPLNIRVVPELSAKHEGMMLAFGTRLRGEIVSIVVEAH